MSVPALPWLDDPAIRRLFDQFPAPLAALASDGGVARVNGPFARGIEPGALEADHIRPLFRHPDGDWHLVELGGHAGERLTARIQAIPLGDGVLVAVDPIETEVHAELRRLRTRVEQLEQDVAIDPLTGLWNRSPLQKVLRAELARGSRLRQPLSMLLLDLDDLRTFNETWSRRVGDAVLAAFARFLVRHTRESDVLFRWADGVFVVLAPGTAVAGAHHLAESLRVLVERQAFAGSHFMTVSVAATEHRTGETVDAWLRRTQVVLAASKVSGPNRVQVEAGGASDDWARESPEAALQLEWKPSYASGEPTIDAEHEALFGFTKAVHDAAQGRPAGRGRVGEALDRLLRHVGEHFAHEEKILAAYNYSKLESHQRAHAALLRKADELFSGCANGHLPPSAVITFMAEEVVARHMLWADRDFHSLFSPVSLGAGRLTSQ